jgi:hypothetical protein
MASVTQLGLFSGCPENLATLLAIGNRLYPNFSLADTLAFYWRVKRWKFSFSGSWIEDNRPDPVTFSYSGEWSFSVGQIVFSDENIPLGQAVYGVIPQSETKLICGVDPVDVSFPNEDNPNGPPFVVTYHHHAFLDARQRVEPDNGIRIGVIIDGGALYREHNGGLLFAPNIYLSINTTRWLAVANESYGVIYGALSINLIGKNFTVPISAMNTRNSTTASFNATLEAEEYWPYDPQDGGGPIYDSSTGAQLRDF